MLHPSSRGSGGARRAQASLPRHGANYYFYLHYSYRSTRYVYYYHYMCTCIRYVSSVAFAKITHPPTLEWLLQAPPRCESAGKHGTTGDAAAAAPGGTLSPGRRVSALRDARPRRPTAPLMRALPMPLPAR